MIDQLMRMVIDSGLPITLAKILVIFGTLMGTLAYLTLVERKMMAWVQMRPGPNRVGPWGLLQPIADGLKFLFKEDVTPPQTTRVIYVLAPVLSLVPALLSYSVIPFGPMLQIANIDVSLLFIFALAGLGIYGIALGGWASNSKYPLLGGLRSSAQMVSYELSMTLSVVGVLLIANSLSLNEIARSQEGAWFGVLPRWNIFVQPIAFLIFVISGVAETNRLPFDLAESEQELVAGWHTEYSSMKFAMFMVAEYANMITVSAVATLLFLGGGNGPLFGPWWLQMALPTVYFLSKIAVFMLFFFLMRATVPRFRYDQLMKFGWKILLPIALANVLITSFAVAVTTP